jgi:hypothetical protein
MYHQINRLCIFASGPNLVLNIFLINQGMFSVGGNTEAMETQTSGDR